MLREYARRHVLPRLAFLGMIAHSRKALRIAGGTAGSGITGILNERRIVYVDAIGKEARRRFPDLGRGR